MEHGERLSYLETDIYGITASQFSRGRSNQEVVRMMLEAGVRIIQYREKDRTLRDKYYECVQLRDLTANYNACFIVNDDVHLALAVEADGVHLGQDDLPVGQTRKIIGPEMLLGLSTHSPEQAEKAVRENVDYIGVGPIYRTYTKKDVGEPVGTGYLDYVARCLQMPFVAIGGIKVSNVAEVVRRGARCVALVTEIVGADNILQRIQAIRAAMNEAKRSDSNG